MHGLVPFSRYDVVGNVLSIVDSKVDGGPQTQSFGYDALDRLLSAAAAGGSAGQGQYSEAYAYNNVGHMTSKGGVSYGYDDADHKHAVTHLGGVQKYWYDANGNMTQRIVGSDTFEQSWDAENRLVQVKKNGAVVASLVYDGDGQRVQATVNGQTTAYVGNYLEWSGNTSTMVTYYYAGGQRVAMRKGSALYYLLGDHLGSTAVTVDSSGTRVAELRYKAYGETRYSYSTTPTNYRFTGQRWEYSVKLYQMGARWYDPALARWLSADTLVPDPATPQSLNRYSYVLGNPLNHTDVSGHRPCGMACPGDYTSWEIGFGAAYRGAWNPAQQAENRAKAEQVTSLVVDFAPGAGDAKGFAEVLTGTDLITGEPLGTWRFLGLLGLSELRGLRYADEAIGALRWVSRTADTVEITGQWHHVLSTKVMRALEEHQTLRGVFGRDDFLIRALDQSSHYGYEGWHRAYDDEIVEWLADPDNANASQQEFMEFLLAICSRSDMLERFPGAVDLLNQALEALE